MYLSILKDCHYGTRLGSSTCRKLGHRRNSFSLSLFRIPFNQRWMHPQLLSTVVPSSPPSPPPFPSSVPSPISPYHPLRDTFVRYLYAIVQEEFPFMRSIVSSVHQMDRYVAIASPRSGPSVDYQINIAIVIAKYSTNQYTPIQVAERILQKFNHDYGAVLPCTLTLPELTAPLHHSTETTVRKKSNSKIDMTTNTPPPTTTLLKGFINISIQKEWLMKQCKLLYQYQIPKNNHDSHTPTSNRRNSSSTFLPSSFSCKILIDFGSPNMGKELHVGHLRSAVVGDTLARILGSSFTNRVIHSIGTIDQHPSQDIQSIAFSSVDRVSHVGDCGLPIALVLTEYIRSTVYQQRYDQLVRLLTKHFSLSINDIFSTYSSSPSKYSLTPSLPSPTELSKMYETAKRLSTQNNDYGTKTQEILRNLQSTLASTIPLVSLSLSLIQRYPLLLPWLDICEASRQGYLPLFERLNVQVTEYGESNYAPLLPSTVEELQQTKLAAEDDGAIVIFTSSPPQKEEEKDNKHTKSATEPPVLIRKRDGGYLYATIDLATIKLRLSKGYDRIIYVTDAAQSAHFQQIFKVAQLAGWIEPFPSSQYTKYPTLANLLNEGGSNLHDSNSMVIGLNKLRNPPVPVVLEHASFGVVTGEGGKKLSSRDGTDLTLVSLLDNGAHTVYSTMEKNQEGTNKNSTSSNSTAATGNPISPSSASLWVPPIANQSKLSSAELLTISEAISTSSIRFFDLFHRRNSNYSFSYDKALTLKGNTAPYVQYAVTRLRTMRKTLAKSLQVVPANRNSAADTVVDWDDLIKYCDDRIADIGKNSSSNDKDTSTWVYPSVPSERVLALTIVRLPEVLSNVYRTLMPHTLAEATVNLAGYVHTYYDEARIFPTLVSDELLKEPLYSNIDLWLTAKHRLEIFRIADYTLRECFQLLGIRIVDRM